MSSPHAGPYGSARDHDQAAIGWVLHILDREDEVAFLAHLETCDDCRRTIAETTEALTAVAQAVPQEEPPARLRENLLAAIAEEPEPPRNSVPTREPVPASSEATVVPMQRDQRSARRARLTRQLVAVAAAVVAVVVIGVLVGANQSLRRERDVEASEYQRSQEIASVLHDAGRPGVAHAVLADPAGGLVGMVVDAGSGPRVMTTNLTANESDHVYVLWSLAGGQPQPMGTFDVSGPSPSVRSVGSEGQAGPAAAYAVSLEPGRTAPAAPTRIVASGQVGR